MDSNIPGRRVVAESLGCVLFLRIIQMVPKANSSEETGVSMMNITCTEKIVPGTMSFFRERRVARAARLCYNFYPIVLPYFGIAVTVLPCRI